jgi:hypothetical protein
MDEMRHSTDRVAEAKPTATTNPETGASGQGQLRARKKPLISDMPPAPPPAPRLAEYEPIIGTFQLDELRFLAKPLVGKRAKMVNSTALGGGVAEMLNRLVPLLDELGVKTNWEVITGGNDFFDVTKAFHNALHGASP